MITGNTAPWKAEDRREGLGPKELTQQKMTEGAPPPLVPGGRRLRQVAGRMGAALQASRASMWPGEGQEERAERGKDNGWQKPRGLRPPAW